MTRKFHFILLLLLLAWYPTKALPNGLDISINTGLATVLGPSSTLSSIGIHAPFRLSIGYTFGSFRVAVEGMAAFPFFQYGASVLGNFTFAANDSLRGYALLGVGYGMIMFFENTGNEDGDIEGNGLTQLQTGIGLGFPIKDWLELGIETRLQIGVPKFPEIVAWTHEAHLMFKF